MSATAERPASVAIGSRSRGRALVYLAYPIGLVAIGVMLPVVLTFLTGVSVLPRNDDWSYRSIAMHLFESGELRLDGASQTFAIGQILPTLPLLTASAGHPLAFWIVGVTASLVVVLAGYRLAREFLPPDLAALVVLSLLFVPGYLVYSTSFMTDVPALAAAMACLLCGVRVFRVRVGWARWAVGAIACGLLAFSIRQFAVAAPVALALTALWFTPRRGIAVALVTGIGAALLTAWTTSLAGQVGSTPILDGGTVRMGAAILSLSLIMLPVTLVSLHRRRGAGSRTTLLLGVLLLGLVIAGFAVRAALPRTLGNLFSPGGILPYNLISPPGWVLSPEIWLVVQVVAVASVVPLGDVLARTTIDAWHRIRPAIRARDDSAAPIALLGSFVLIYLGGLLLYAFAFATFDRYLWPVVIPLGVLLLRPVVGPSTETSPQPARASLSVVVAWMLAAVYSLLAVVYLLNSVAFDRARWDAGEALVGVGYEASEVDAGYEWLGTYAPGPPRVFDRQTRPRDPLAWYGNIWQNFRRCALVAGTESTFDGFEPLETLGPSYRQFLFFGPETTLRLSGSTDPACDFTARS